MRFPQQVDWYASLTQFRPSWNWPVLIECFLLLSFSFSPSEPVCPPLSSFLPSFLPSLHPLHPSPPHHAIRFQWRPRKTKWEVSWILHLPCCLINGETPFPISWAEIAALSLLWARQAVPPSCSFPHGHYFCYLLPLSLLPLLYLLCHPFFSVIFFN